MKAWRGVLLIALVGLMLPSFQSAAQAKKTEKKSHDAQGIMWRDPGAISAENLFYGPGSEALAPVPPFRFLEEDKAGTNPKFKVKDSRDVEWAVKLGRESQSETVATHIVWAVGYFTEEAYYYPSVHIDGFQQLSRGHAFFDSSGNVREARFEPRRSDVKRGDEWAWRDNPFVGTRELNGLKVMMILINNWDVKDANNRVLITKIAGKDNTEARFTLTDLGASFGRAKGLGGGRTRNDVKGYVASRFVKGIHHDGTVDFYYDLTPTGFGFLTALFPPAFMRQQRKDDNMADIPVAHARWIASYLAQLSDSQLTDAFRAAQYDDATVNQYVSALRNRINQLNQLGPEHYASSDTTSSTPKP